MTSTEIRNKGNKFGKEEEFNLNQNNQIKIYRKQLEEQGFKWQRRIMSRDLRIIQTKETAQ